MTTNNKTHLQAMSEAIDEVQRCSWAAAESAAASEEAAHALSNATVRVLFPTVKVRETTSAMKSILDDVIRLGKEAEVCSAQAAADAELHRQANEKLVAIAKAMAK